MDELMDMMVSDESPSQISDKIKDILYGKAAERIDAFRPMVANGVFGEDDIEVEDDEEETLEVSNELETETETEDETEEESE
tara:strand:- start:4 stop:249 length:246 start_codon:yes stop_codon:yes gene_type:complete